MKTSFAQLGVAIRLGIADAPRLVLARWPLYLGFILVAGVGDFALYHAHVYGQFFTSVLIFVVPFFVLVDTMRLDDLEFRGTPGLITRYVLLTLVLFAYVIPAALVALITVNLINALVRIFPPYAFMNMHLTIEIAGLIVLLFMIVVSSRFTFAGFAIARGLRVREALGRSWKFTSHSRNLPTFVITVAYSAIGLLLDPIIRSLHDFSAFAQMSLSIGLVALVYPIMLRWMQFCEEGQGQTLCDSTTVGGKPFLLHGETIDFDLAHNAQLNEEPHADAQPPA